MADDRNMQKTKEVRKLEKKCHRKGKKHTGLEC